jgi:hypothetical protein
LFDDAGVLQCAGGGFFDTMFAQKLSDCFRRCNATGDVQVGSNHDTFWDGVLSNHICIIISYSAGF